MDLMHADTFCYANLGNMEKRKLRAVLRVSKVVTLLIGHI